MTPPNRIEEVLKEFEEKGEGRVRFMWDRPSARSWLKDQLTQVDQEARRDVVNEVKEAWFAIRFIDINDNFDPEAHILGSHIMKTSREDFERFEYVLNDLIQKP